jgi:flagellar motility protein MotE (MotC chaperone)
MPAPQTLSKLRILPITIAIAGLAFGVHAGEVVQQLRTPEKPAVPGKPADSVLLQTRTEIELADEIAAKSAGANNAKRQMDLRSRLLEASEQRIDTKLAQLKAAEAHGSDANPTSRNPQFASLVKVYEVMKPKDAARIFEKLDLPVQLAVATAMKERSMAALMAEMSPEAARRLTMEMAAQAQLSNVNWRQGRSYVAR